jgi:diguanylate cyclase
MNAYLYYELHRIRVSRRELLRQLLIVEKSAQLDPLTGAFNRRCLNQLLQKEISRAERKGSKLSVILADVNDFKAFNTRFGHLVGDEVLSQVAKILASALRASDTIVRYGGDEFVVILGDTDRQQAGVAVNRINEYLQAWNRKERAMRMEVTVTCGIAEFTKGWSATELINRADAEMLAGKTASKARILDASQ